MGTIYDTGRAVEQAGFQYVRTLGGYQCPIHRDGEPVTAPLGLRFAERVHIESIPQHIAAAIYDAYHSYMDDVPRTNIVYHGLCYQDQLVGAITWRHPLIRTLHSDDTPYQGDESLRFVDDLLNTTAETYLTVSSLSCKNYLMSVLSPVPGVSVRTTARPSDNHRSAWYQGWDYRVKRTCSHVHSGT